jgi:hypothetical protein
MNNSGQINIIFYSQMCSDSNSLLKILQNENLLSYFKLYCVDGKLKDIPAGITAVPTMIVTSIKKPLVGIECFKWISQIKFLQQQQQNSREKQIIQQNILKFENTNSNNGPSGFVQAEMSGLSDKYAYTKRDDAQPKSYSDANSNNGTAIFTAPEHGKINKGDQLKLVNDITKTRDNQDNHYSGIMKKQQIHAVLNNEKNNS